MYENFLFNESSNFVIVCRSIRSTTQSDRLHCVYVRHYLPVSVVQVHWEKNGNVVSPATDNNIILVDGRLVIRSVRVTDVGEYVCVASNSAGRVLSSPALLQLYQRELIVSQIHLSISTLSVQIYRNGVSDFTLIRIVDSTSMSNRTFWL